MGHPGVTIRTSLDPNQSCGIGTVSIEGVDNAELANHLFSKHRIVITTIKHEDFGGIRITPNTYTTLREMDIFCEEMEEVIKNGLPSQEVIRSAIRWPTPVAQGGSPNG